MSKKIDERPIYEGESYYYDNAIEPISLAAGPNTEVTCLKRLQMELNYKSYYVWDDYVVFLDENGLNWQDIYDKNIHEIKLLKTVIAIQEALKTQIDYYMKVEMNFGSRSEAYGNLQKNINGLEKRIRKIEESKTENQSDITFMFSD